MKRLTLIVFITAASLLFVSGKVLAKTEYMYSSGTCANGNQWFCVTEYSNGMAVSCRGVDCSGYDYYKTCDVAVIPTNPFAGSTPNATGVCDYPATSWHALITFTSEGYPSQLCGQDCNGQYWTATLVSDNKPGLKKNPNPSTPEIEVSPSPGRHIN